MVRGMLKHVFVARELIVVSPPPRLTELDSLDMWINLLTPSQKKGSKSDADNTESLHVLLALKYSEDEEENAKPMIAGGLAFEYYPSNNCGLLTYLITPSGERGGRMARALIEQVQVSVNSTHSF